MLNSLRLFCRILLLLLPVILPAGVNAQIFTGTLQPAVSSDKLDKVLQKWEVYSLDPTLIQQYVRSNADVASVKLKLGDHNWMLDLQPSNILAPDYFLQVEDNGQVEKLPRSDHRAFKGFETQSNGSVRLTMDKNFLLGYIEDGTDRYYVEPLYYHLPDAAKDLYLVYPMSAVIRDQDATCIELASEESLQNLPGVKDVATPDLSACYELEIAIASDHSMFTKYGSVTGVENHNIAIINDVEGDYTGNFNNDLSFVIVTQFVATGTDPWSSSTDAGILLGSFRTWGNAGNFGVTFDVGELWTNRDFDGPTVGIAYLNGICNSNKYHCLQDFTGNSELLRCMTSHELGHNFSASHDTGPGDCPPNYIMCPFVSTSTVWSSTSTSSINGYMQSRINNGCLSPCASGPPLVADFSWDPDPPCVNQQVQFSDLSSGTITTRSWVFPGGTPPTSNLTNPLVTWTTPGVKNVTLTLSGIGGPVSTSKQITVKPAPTANFTYSIIEPLTYVFTNTSLNGNSYLWDFGDGNQSVEENPVYTYSEAGIYTIVLTVENECGTSTKSLLVNTIPIAGFTANPTSGCATLAVSFTNESSFNATSYLWSFPGAQPTSSSQPNPVVVYTTSGTYTVSLTVYNTTGSNTFTAVNYISVQTVPAASFTFTTSGQTVSFTNTSVGAGTYLWNFGDGETSTDANPTHTYSTGGLYTVTLTVTNGCGSTTATHSITLIAPPTASFTSNVTSGCGPLTVQFTSTSGGNPNNFTWSFPGGTPNSATIPNPTVTYSTPGTYSVTLTVSNAAGTNTATQSNYITVQTTPVAGFTSTINGATVNFTNTSTNAVTYSWNFGDTQTGTAQNPTHTYGADGTYTVTLTATGPCGTNTFTQSVVIGTPPSASFTATPTSGCGPLTVQFTSTSSANTASLLWSFPGGSPASATTANPIVVYSTAGTYSVTLVATNGVGSDTTTLTGFVTVNPNPTAGFTSTTTGSVASFLNTSTNANTYNWNFGDGNSSPAQNPTHTYENDGTYTVTLTAANPCGNSTFTQTVTIATPPTAAFTATPTSGCGPLTVQFTNASSANAVSYAWSFPGGAPTSSTEQNPIVVYNTPGVYAVTLVVTNTAGSNTATQSNFVSVNAGPTAGFTGTANGSVATFNNSSTNAISYSWNFGDGGMSADQNPVHTYSADGTYTVTLTAANPCGTSTFTQTLTIATPPTAGFTASPTSGCGPLTVQFTNASSANAVTYAWVFPGGTPSSSGAQNPLVTYNAPGIYSVTLTVSNAAGSNSTTQSNLVSVNPTPTAGFTSTVNAATAFFTNTSTNAVSYNWDFGDNTTSPVPNPSHSYTADGTYTVVLTATNACGTATFTQSVVIITSPNAGFTANTTSGCGPLTVNFIDLSSDNTTAWEWTFPGGTPGSSTAQNPTVVYDTPGSYDVTLVASTTAGSSTFTQSNFITVLPLPTAGFTASVSGPTAVFTNTSSDATSYLWDFGDNSTSNQANPSHTYSADGIYTVTLTAINNCGSQIFTGTVQAVTAPQAGFTASSSNGCAPLTVLFTNASSANATGFQWTFEGGNPASSTDMNPSVIWNQPGTYLVTLVASNSAGSSTSTSSITVLGPPTAGFTVQLAGLSIVTTNTSTGATAYHWDFGDGNTSSVPNPTYAYGLPGIYTVVLTASNSCGDTQFGQTVEITGTAPIAAFGVSEQSGCAPFTVQFADQSAGSPTAWQWTFPGGTPAGSTAQNPTVTYDQPGVYSVTLAVTNPYGSNTATQADYIKVIDIPTAAFTYTADQLTLVFTNGSQNGDSYTWNFGDGTMSNAAEPVHTYAAPGSYTVSLTVVNACGANTLEQMITLTSGTGEATWLQQFRLYPNPGTGIFTLEMAGDARKNIDFVLYNAIGQVMAQDEADFGTGSLKRQLEYGHLPAGMYTLQIRSGAGSLMHKLVIQR